MDTLTGSVALTFNSMAVGTTATDLDNISWTAFENSAVGYCDWYVEADNTITTLKVMPMDSSGNMLTGVSATWDSNYEEYTAKPGFATRTAFTINLGAAGSKISSATPVVSGAVSLEISWVHSLMAAQTVRVGLFWWDTGLSAFPADSNGNVRPIYSIDFVFTDSPQFSSGGYLLYATHFCTPSLAINPSPHVSYH